jgi:hypothetical protein
MGGGLRETAEVAQKDGMWGDMSLSMIFDGILRIFRSRYAMVFVLFPSSLSLENSQIPPITKAFEIVRPN